MSTYKAGTTIISLFYALLKAVQVYDINNDVVQTTAKKLVYNIKSLLTMYSHIELIRYRDYVFFNKQRLRYEIDGYASLQSIHDKFKKLNVKSLTFSPGIDREEIIVFSSIFKDEKDIFMKQLSSAHFKNVSIEFSTDEDEIPDFLQNGERVKRTYFKALRVTKDLIQNLWLGKSVDVRQSRRIIYGLIDSLYQDEFGLLALTSIKNFDEYTFNHSLNVGILSLALGQRIGLSKRNLVALGTAGLLHDIGKVLIPKDLIYKAENLDDEEWEILKHHSDYGVKEIIKTRGLDEIGLISMTVAYQHHWNYNGTGYPIHKSTEQPILYSKIVRICDSYDAMTTARVYQPVPYLPYFALRVIWKLKNTCFDPILVKTFINLLGLFPIGSCLELNNNEIGLVIRQNQGHPNRPIVKMIINKEGKKISGRIIDLSIERKFTILKPVYAQKYGVNPATYFV